MPAYSLLQLIVLAILLRLVFDFTVLPHRAVHTGAYQDKQDAQQISETTQGNDVYLWQDTRFSLSTVFYLERDTGKVLSRRYERNPQDFYLADRQLLSSEDYQVFYTFSDQNGDFLLIKFK